MEFRCIAATPSTLAEAWSGDTLAIGLFHLDEDPAE